MAIMTPGRALTGTSRRSEALHAKEIMMIRCQFKARAMCSGKGGRTDGAKKSSDTSSTFPPSATDDTSVDVVPRTASNSDRGRIV